MRSREIVGRRIVGYRANRFYAGRGRQYWTTAPEIVLDDGSVLRFVAVETEVSEYGVDVVRVKPAKRRGKGER